MFDPLVSVLFHSFVNFFIRIKVIFYKHHFGCEKPIKHLLLYLQYMLKLIYHTYTKVYW